MIVLTNIQKNYFNNFKIQYEIILNSRNVDVVPIEIQNNLWIFPENILLDSDFSELISALKSNGFFDTVTIRDVLDSELIISSK